MEKAAEEIIKLKPETETFIRGLVQQFYDKKDFKIDTKNNKFWDLFVDDLMYAVKNNDLKKKIIYTRDGKEEYLLRYYLINERPKLRVTIHNTLLSDESGLHNHPWKFGSLILMGGYWENTPEGRFWKSPGDFRVRSEKDYHSLEVDPNVKEEVWTLFIMGEKKQDWGFLNENGEAEQWQKYLYRQRGVWYNEEG